MDSKNRIGNINDKLMAMFDQKKDCNCLKNSKNDEPSQLQQPQKQAQKQEKKILDRLPVFNFFDSGFCSLNAGAIVKETLPYRNGIYYVHLT